MRWAGHVACIGAMKVANRVLVGNLGGDHLEYPGVRWEVNIKMYLQEVGWLGGDVAWIDLTQDRDRWRTLVNVVINLQVP